MPDTEQVSPGEETQNPAPVVEAPEVTIPEVEAEAKDEESKTEPVEPEEDEASKSLKRMQRRIDKRTADVYRTRAENEQLKARLAEVESKSGSEERPQEQTDPRVLAKEIARIERFTEQANSIVAQGNKSHPDYMTALQELSREVGDFVKPDGAPSAFMEVVLEVVDKPAALLYHLGKNPDLAEELSGLSPLKLAKQLDRIERELEDKSTQKPSKAPKPLEAVKVVSIRAGEPSDTDSIDDWVRKERARQSKRQG